MTRKTIIREAQRGDVDSISKLLGSLQLKRNDPNLSKKTTGLLEYTKTTDQLMGLLDDYFLVAEDNGIRGVALAYSDFIFRNQHWDASNTRDAYIIDNFKSRFVYFDLLAVANPLSIGSGRIASELYNEVERRAIQTGMPKIVGYVRHEPFQNIRSLKFTTSKGFELVAEVEMADKGVLGLYQKNLEVKK